MLPRPLGVVSQTVGSALQRTDYNSEGTLRDGHGRSWGLVSPSHRLLGIKRKGACLVFSFLPSWLIVSWVCSAGVVGVTLGSRRSPYSQLGF